MKVKLKNGIEIECTPEEFEILYNKGFISGIKTETITIPTPDTTIRIDENDPWEVIIKPKQPNTDPYTPREDPFRDNTVMMYGCQVPNDSIRYLHTSPTAGTEADSLTPEQFMKLKSIVGDTSNDKPGDNTVRV